MLPNPEAIEERRKEKQNNNLSRDKIDEETRQKLVNVIQAIDDPNLAEAVRELSHVLTGDNRFDTEK
jgi:hypothetical protein